MSNLSSDFPVIQGLTKREQSKLQRLIKTSEAQKANNHSKSYKRKPGKDKQLMEQPQRKLIKTESTPPDLKSQSGSSPILNQVPLKANLAKEKERKKVDPKHQKVYNPNFLKDQVSGQEGLFEYIMMYSYTEKEKKMDSPPQDLGFVDQLKGTKLTVTKNTFIQSKQNEIMDKFKKIKKNIEQPFNEAHMQFIEQNFAKSKKQQ